MTPREHGLIAALIGLLAALVLIPIFRVLANRLGVVDRPGPAGGRKTQSAPVPLLGGVGVALAGVVGVLTVGWLWPEEQSMTLGAHGHIVLAAGLIFLLGLVDDVFKDRVGPLPKFIGQFLAVGVLFGDHYILVFSGEATGGQVFHLVATTIWFLTVLNAVNFIDNMNGLCAGISAISLLVGLLGVAGMQDVRWAVLAGAMGGGLVGFLPYNYPKARIYLGDAGSHLAGFFLALLSLEFTGGFLSEGSSFFGFDSFIPAMLLLGIPLFDILFSVVRRGMEGRSLVHGDARHLSHRLVGAGLDQTSATMLLWGGQLILAAAGVFSLSWGPRGRWAIFIVVLIVMGILSSILVRMDRKRGQEPQK